MKRTTSDPLQSVSKITKLENELSWNPRRYDRCTNPAVESISLSLSLSLSLSEKGIHPSVNTAGSSEALD